MKKKDKLYGLNFFQILVKDNYILLARIVGQNDYIL